MTTPRLTVPEPIDYNHAILALTDELANAEWIIQFHNKTPTGRTRKCLPGCAACAWLAARATPNPEPHLRRNPAWHSPNDLWNEVTCDPE